MKQKQLNSSSQWEICPRKSSRHSLRRSSLFLWRLVRQISVPEQCNDVHVHNPANKTTTFTKATLR